jgi:hypothetical protein
MTVKLASPPACTATALGCVVIVGAVFTVKAAALLVTDPALLVTETV